MKHLLFSILAAVLFGVFGCTSADSDRERFDRIAKDLETGGSCHFISSSRSAGTALKEIIRQSEKYTWDSPLPPETQFQMQRLISSSELWARVAGIHELKGWGGSSKQLPSAKEVRFRNKLRLLLPPQPQGLLWRLFSSKNIPLEEQFYNLPGDTYFAGAVHISAETLKQLTAAEKKLPPSVTDFCKIIFNMAPAELAAELSGIWRVIVVCDEANDTGNLAGVHISLTLPDKEGKLFKAICDKTKFFSGTVVDQQKKTIKFAKIPGKLCIPYAVSSNGTLTISTSQRSFHRTHPLESFPRLSASVKRLSNYTTLDGIAAFYSRNDSDMILARTIDMSRKREAFSVVRSLPDGILVDNISRSDLNALTILTTAAFPVHFILEILSAPPEQKMPAAAPQPQKKFQSVRPIVLKTPPQKSAAPATARSSCLKGIEITGKALLKAAAKSGSWNAPGIAGLRRFVAKKQLSPAFLICPATGLKNSNSDQLNYANCHYLYFGEPGKNSPKTPVLMELPFLHKEHFSVFYADGSVEMIRLSGRRNVRRAISYLHTVHSYEEEEFLRLIQFASELDKILER